MKIKRFSYGATAAILVLSAMVAQQSSAAEPEWKLAKDIDGIKVFTHPVVNSPLSEFKGEIDILVKPEQVVKALKDANSFKKWMPDVIKSELLTSSESDQNHYLENAVPWPLENRDGVYHFTYSRSDDGANAVITVRVEALPDYLPRKDGKVRIPRSDGFWQISPTASGAHVIWQIHADPGGSIPAWMVNSTVVDTPFNTLKRLRSYLQGPVAQ